MQWLHCLFRKCSTAQPIYFSLNPSWLLFQASWQQHRHYRTFHRFWMHLKPEYQPLLFRNDSALAAFDITTLLRRENWHLDDRHCCCCCFFLELQVVLYYIIFFMCWIISVVPGPIKPTFFFFIPENGLFGDTRFPSNCNDNSFTAKT